MHLHRQLSIPSNKVKVAAITTSLGVLLALGFYISWQRSGLLYSLPLINDDGLYGEEDRGLLDTSQVLPNRPALIAATRVKQDVIWMDDLADG